jgi:hypothetical protein
MPVRKVSNRGGNIIGRFPSLKLKRMVDYESLIERDFLYLLDFEPEVTWFMEQPLTITYTDQAKTRNYTPDFHMISNGRNILVECKPQQFVTKASNQLKFAAAEHWCTAKDWDFQVVTDEQLHSSYRLHNIKYLTQFARYNIAAEVKNRIHTFLSTVPAPITIAKITAQLAPQASQSLLIPIYHMAFHHKLRLPLDEAPVSLNSLVHLPLNKEAN